MAFIPAKCPQCGGDISVPDDRDVVKCMYCGVDVVIRDAIRLITGNTKHFFELANTAASAGNYLEAETYYTKILEIEPRNSKAWAGKGTAAGWLSNLNKLRLNEMISFFNKAIEFSESEASKEVMRMECGMDALLVAHAVFSTSTEHTIKFISVPTAKYEHFDRCKEVIELCKIIINYNENQTEAWELILDIASRQLNVSGRTDSETEYFKSAKRLAESKLPLSSIKESNNSCFVITATMGNEDHPIVNLLRTFRSTVLLKAKYGVIFNDWYHKNGPAFAKIIGISKTLRLASFVLIVIPSAFFALTWLTINRCLRK